MAFLRREVPVEGRDFCDMSAAYSKPLEEFSIINILLPSKYENKHSVFFGPAHPSMGFLANSCESSYCIFILSTSYARHSYERFLFINTFFKFCVLSVGVIDVGMTCLSN